MGSLLAMAIGGAAMLRRRAKRRSSEQLTPDGGLPISLPWSVPSQTRYELLEATAVVHRVFSLPQGAVDDGSPPDACLRRKACKPARQGAWIRTPPRPPSAMAQPPPGKAVAAVGRMPPRMGVPA